MTARAAEVVVWPRASYRPCGQRVGAVRHGRGVPRRRVGRRGRGSDERLAGVELDLDHADVVGGGRGDRHDAGDGRRVGGAVSDTVGALASIWSVCVWVGSALPALSQERYLRVVLVVAVIGPL